MIERATIPVITYRGTPITMMRADSGGRTVLLWFANGVYLPDMKTIEKQLEAQGWILRLIGWTPYGQYIQAVRK